ncbi:MAG: hypothetical protein HY553_18900 [Elusimicrobia bacterium]|nr:hypothetical protein [Elusimicrobiota bacterium]
MSEDGELVSSGSFRVDRALALEKLREFQTPDPRLFMLPWVRAAVAGGATRIRMDLTKTADFMMSFDGDPVRAEMADPSVALFGDQKDRRLRHLAVGLLAALRLRPKLVSLASGEGKRRRCLRLGAAGDSFEAQEAETGDTILWVIPWEGVPLDRWYLRVLDACRACPARLSIGATDLSPFDGKGAKGLWVRERRRRIWLEPAAKGSKGVDVYHLGVHAGKMNPKRPVAGFVDDPALTLDASCSSVVRNEAYAEAAEAVSDIADRLWSGLRED